MSKSVPKPKNLAIVERSASGAVPSAGFDEVLTLINSARVRTVAAVNTALIDLYWSIGQHISGKVSQDGWGEGTVRALAEYIRHRLPNARGFSAQNLWRMRQLFEMYRADPKLSALLRELPWTQNLMILSGCKSAEERGFYLRMAAQERWSSRQLERRLFGDLFERVALSPAKLAPPLREFHPDAAAVFKDSYLVEFLDLPCATKNEEVVEYALSRTASSAVIAEYQTRLPDKQLLRAKLHEFYESAQQHSDPKAGGQLLQGYSGKSLSSAAARKRRAKQSRNRPG